MLRAWSPEENVGEVKSFVVLFQSDNLSYQDRCHTALL